MNLKILISVYNISGYLMAGVKALLERGADVRIIERPCRLSESAYGSFPEVSWINREEIHAISDLQKRLKDWHPDVFLSCGWNDKVCRGLAFALKREGVTTVVGVDNPWEGSVRQFVHCLFSRLYLTKAFDYGWGAGDPHVRYLKYLGFSADRVAKGFYSADTSKFANLISGRRDSWPHKFIYVGRYVPDKNMRRMEQGFIKAIECMPESDWKLRCIGGGELWDERTKHPRIEHLGYKAPSELQDYIKDSGCFVLASTTEHWGVVVHEFALMGLPMICSQRVMATTEFVKDGVNGYLFNPYDVNAIADGFLRIMKLGDNDLLRMSTESKKLGMKYTTGDWADRLLSMRRTSYGKTD